MRGSRPSAGSLEAPQFLDAASSRLDQIQAALTQQLSNTEDADFTKTMIDFNSQSAAYQASLRAGANIVQASLMDFLH